MLEGFVTHPMCISSPHQAKWQKIISKPWEFFYWIRKQSRLCQHILFRGGQNGGLCNKWYRHWFLVHCIDGVSFNVCAFPDFFDHCWSILPPLSQQIQHYRKEKYCSHAVYLYNPTLYYTLVSSFPILSTTLSSFYILVI